MKLAGWRIVVNSKWNGKSGEFPISELDFFAITFYYLCFCYSSWAREWRD